MSADLPHAIEGYRTLVGSDVVHDGMYLEVSDGAGYVITVFRSDVNGAMTLSTGRSDIPVEVVEWAIGEARRRLRAD